MRLILVFSFLLFGSSIFSQQCFPETKKDKRLVKKIQRLIKKAKYYSASSAFKKAHDASFFYALKSEILFRQGDFFNSETFKSFSTYKIFRFIFLPYGIEKSFFSI